MIQKIQFAREFESLKQQGRLNRLETIAVCNVQLVSAGLQNHEMFVTVRFTANLLDYAVQKELPGIGDEQGFVQQLECADHILCLFTGNPV